MHNKSVLIVGTFLSKGHRAVGEDLALKLSGRGWSAMTTSAQANKMLRLSDMLATVWRQRRSYDVALVDVFSGPAFIWAEAVCAVLRRLRKPTILTLRGGSLPDFAARHPDRVRRLLQSAAAVTTPSNYLLSAMQAYRADLHLIPNPLEIAHYRYVPRRQASPRLVWLRALHTIYNPTLAVEVVARLRQEFPDIHLTMVGPDKGDGSQAAVVQAAMTLGVTDRITLTGGVPKADVAAWLNKGDIFLNTTNVDNTPVSVTEAMACGLCVVSTNVGGIPHLLDDEQNALLVPPNDSMAMAAAVRRILRDPALAERLSANAREKVETFAWTVVLPQWEQLIQQVTSVSAPHRSETHEPSMNRSH